MGSFRYVNESKCDSSTNFYDTGPAYGRPGSGSSWNRLSLSTPPISHSEMVSPRSTNDNFQRLNPPSYGPIDYEGGGDARHMINLKKKQSFSQFDNINNKDRAGCYNYEGPGPEEDHIIALSNQDKLMRDELEKEKKMKLMLAKRSTCKFCDTTDKNGVCQCPIHLPTVHSRYMRVLEDKSRNSLAIYIFRNGENRVAPILIQIPKRNMRSMDEAMKYIDQSVRFPVGYANALYSLGGDMVYEPNQIKPYDTYVVANNIKRKFIHMDYGNKKPEALCLRRRRRFNPPETFQVSLAHYNRL